MKDYSKIAKDCDEYADHFDGFINELLNDACGAVKELQSRLEQAEKDSEILEWMASRYLCADFRYGEPATEAIVIEIPRGSRVFGNLRQDIQAAMTKESAQ